MSHTLRSHARAIFQAGLEAVDPGSAVQRVSRVEAGTLFLGDEALSLEELGSIRVVGMGKASAAMALPLEGMLDHGIQEGLIVVKYGHGLPLDRIRVMEGGHPVPDQGGEAGARALIRTVSRAEEGDLVLCLISGGGSALTPAPAPGVALEDKQEVTRLLLSSGATIHQMNTIRKHLSRLKGGQLARLAHPARVISLILSDVVGDDLGIIASGPTVADSSTFQDALDILEEKNLLKQVPASVLRHLRAGTRGESQETPKPGDPVLADVKNLIVGSNDRALDAAEEAAEALGYQVIRPVGFQEGEARDVAEAQVAMARAVATEARVPARPFCILTGGETTVTLKGDGLGGRNQEFALAGALALEGMEGILLLSGGTDGTDGPTDAAGAFADGSTVWRGLRSGLDASAFLERNDSYRFFEPLGDLFITGPTRTNVMDLRIILSSPPETP